MKYKLWNKRTKCYDFECKNLKELKDILVLYHSRDNFDIPDFIEEEWLKSRTINQILSEYKEWKIIKEND